MSNNGNPILIHEGLVGLSFFLSFLILRIIDPFPGDAIDAMVLAVLFSHALAALLSLALTRVSVASCVIVFVIAFSVPALMAASALKKAAYMKWYAVEDRFRENIDSPIPGSVANLRFVSLQEKIQPDLIMRFDIAPHDLDAIIEKKLLRHVDPSSLMNPEDLFRLPYYLPMANEYKLFQGRDQWGNVVTIKTNEDHSHATVRMENEAFYRDRHWDKSDPVRRKMEDDALAVMKREYEARGKRQ